MSSRTVRRHALSLLAAAALFVVPALAQSPLPDSPEIRNRVDAIVKKMTLEEKIDYIGGTGFAVRAMPGLNLPAFEMSDGPYGVRSNAGFPSTTYAAGIGLAATWNRDLAFRVGQGIGRDARARGIHYMLGPGINIYRSPHNGRNFEYFGEDPFLTSTMDVGYITGMQTQGVSATVKHFMGNNAEYLRHDENSIIDERTAREIYLPGFEAAVTKAHVGSIMDSYNLTNGLHLTQNPVFNTQIARKDWGFDGVLMSDWDATYDAVGAANGGLDLEMPFGKFMNRKNLLPAIKDGRVAESTIDQKVHNILDLAARFGWLDHPQTNPDLSLFNAENKAVALDAAREGMVLLKNEGGVLPLDKSKVKTLLVVGPDAFPGIPVGGGSAKAIPFHTISPLEGISGYLGTAVNVLYSRGLPTITEIARDTQFMTAAEGGKPGVTLETFANADLSGEARTSTVHRINTGGVSWESFMDDPDAAMAMFFSGAKHETSHRYTGYYMAPAAGNYIFAMQGAGEGTSNRVYVDGKLIFDNWKIVRAFQPQTTLALTAGAHKIVVEDAQHGLIGGRLRFGIVAEDKVVTPAVRAMAAHADAVVVTAGFDADSEGEGGDRTFDLPFGQDELIREVAAANKNTIVTITSGGNVNSASWIDKVPGVLENWYAGQEGGMALAEVLFGDVNPSGHLPATFERNEQDNPAAASYYPDKDGGIDVTYKEGIFVGYRGYDHNHTKPLFPFGYGLSYTTFQLANLAVHSDGATATVTVDVTNTGKRAGAEVAQVYVSDGHASVPRPEKELKGFAKVSLQPGETKQVSISLDPRAFAYWDTNAHKWTIAPGSFTIGVGDSSDALPLKGKVDISAAAAKAAF
ncbi:MAG: glycoside hydrolase family 3 C-terminal domain-containing protein [Acidobacteriota bacterium]|nr:glycoside hydrolase family 3 C-terminal domain-containing protein [Acidobacteriota bacterium]